MKVKKRHFLKKKEIKKIKDKLDEYSEIISEDSNVEIAYTTEFPLILVNKEPFAILYNKKIIPTLKAIIKTNIKPKKKVTVDMGAIKYISNGADVMCPGIVKADSKIKKGDITVVIDEKHGKPLAIGFALIDGDEMTKRERGRAVKNIHYVGDKVWNLDL